MSLKTDDFKSYLYSIDRSELLAIAQDLSISDAYDMDTELLITECAERLEIEEEEISNVV